MSRRMLLTMVILLSTFVSVSADAMTCYAGDESSGWCCETYPGTRVTNFVGYGDACAYDGTGCTECVDTGEGDSCVTSGTYCSVMRPVHRR